MPKGKQRRHAAKGAPSPPRRKEKPVPTFPPYAPGNFCADDCHRRHRMIVYRRDGFRCVYCGLDGSANLKLLTLDHVIPKSKGGAATPDNLVTACKPCNLEKDDRLDWNSDKARAAVDRGAPL